MITSSFPFSVTILPSFLIFLVHSPLSSLYFPGVHSSILLHVCYRLHFYFWLDLLFWLSLSASWNASPQPQIVFCPPFLTLHPHFGSISEHWRSQGIVYFDCCFPSHSRLHSSGILSTHFGYQKQFICSLIFPSITILLRTGSFPLKGSAFVFHVGMFITYFLSIFSSLDIFFCNSFSDRMI